MADWPSGPPASPPDGRGLQVGGAEYPAAPPVEWPAAGTVGPPLWGGQWGGPPPEPERSGGSGRSWPAVVTALVIVAVLALVITGVGILASSGSDDVALDGTDSTDTTGTTAPEGPTGPVMPTMPSIPGFAPPPGADPEAQARPLEEVLPELIAFVEEARGHAFETEPVVEAVTDEEFVERLLSAGGDDVAIGLTDETALIALGHLQPGFDLDQAFDDLAGVGVLGFYEPETQELLVKGDTITPFVQSIIVHELTHALDDQIFDLSRLELFAEAGDESAVAFRALVEGTAREVQVAFEEQMSDEDREAYEAEELALGFEQLPSGMAIPPYLLIESQVAYASGERFVEALVAEGGMAQVDAAYEDPPTTSEQILDPAVFLAGEGAVGLNGPEAPAGVEVTASGAFGAVDLRLLGLLSDPTSLVDPNLGALDPVEGFGGGRYVAWSEDGQSCISLEAVGDDAAGSATIAEALDAWAAMVLDAEVGSRPGGNGVEVVTALSCV